MIRKREKLGKVDPFSLGEEFGSSMTEVLEEEEQLPSRPSTSEEDEIKDEDQPKPESEEQVEIATDESEEELEAQEKETPDVSEDEEHEEEEEQAQPSEETSEEEINIDETELTRVLAESWKEDGFINDDFEVTEKTTIDDLFDARKAEIDTIVRNEIEAETQQRLAEQGYTPEVLETAKYIAQGADPNLLSEANYYKRLSNLEFEGESDEDVQTKKEFVSAYLIDRGFNEERANSLVEKSFDDGEDKDLVEEAKTYFGEKSNQILSQEKNRQAALEEEMKAKREKTVQRINNMLNDGEIAGQKYSKDQMEAVRKSLFEKSEVIVDDKGNKVRVTPFVKKRMEIRNDPEKELKYIIDFVLGVDPSEIEAKARSKGSRDTLKKLRAVVTKSDSKVDISSKSDEKTGKESRPKRQREKLVGA